jgi:hydrogenase/urease accessory protein HupE
VGKRWPQAIIMVSGAALIAVGVLFTGAQLALEFMRGPPIANSASATPSQRIVVSSSQVDATTRFVGLELVIVGTVLQVIGYVSTRPWTSNKDGN